MGVRTNLTDEQLSLAEGYHDGATSWELSAWIDCSVELERINKHRGTHMTQGELNQVLRTAIELRSEEDR